MTSFGMGIGPRVVRLADFNHDNRLDVVTVDQASHVLSIRLGNGDGTFGQLRQYSTGPIPLGLTVGDFNHDGHLDAAAALHDGEGVSILFGSGDGTFLSGGYYRIGSHVYDLDTADIDGDGRLDIVAVVPDRFVAYVYYNSGDGTFQTPILFATQDHPYHVLLTDLNNDSKPDILTTHYDTDSLSILLHGPEPVAVLSGSLQLDGITGGAAAQDITFTFRSIGHQDIVLTTAVAPNGNFTLPDVPRREYTLHIKGDRYLATNVPVDMRAGGIAGITALLRAGDANNDNFCDVFDLDLLIQSFNSMEGDPDWNNGVADFNGDRSVDVFDLDLLIQNFNAEGDF
jgi:hypothetical protein